MRYYSYCKEVYDLCSQLAPYESELLTVRERFKNIYYIESPNIKLTIEDGPKGPELKSHAGVTHNDLAYHVWKTIMDCFTLKLCSQCKGKGEDWTPVDIVPCNNCNGDGVIFKLKSE